MQYDPADTIAAIGTAPGGALRGMVRLSGPDVVDCLEACFRLSDTNQRLHDMQHSCVVPGSFLLNDDDYHELPCDVFFWPNQRSYTRQTTAELHTFGSPPLLEKVLARVCGCGARLAEPGEFTLRAFLAGRVDLTQAEAVLGVIDAQSDVDLQTALSQLAGGLATPLEELREQLLQLLTELEAGLDFVDEDIEFITADQLREQITRAQAIVDEVLAQLASREQASDLHRVVLVGAPNAGKSSLFNALIERYASASTESQSLVSKQSGTTRDFVTAAIEIHGLACELVDTAGADSSADAHSIDQIAQEMTSQQRAQADILLRCAPASKENRRPLDCREIVVRTKSDLVDAKPPTDSWQVACSSLDGYGLNDLARLIHVRLADMTTETRCSTAITAARCTESMRQASEALTRALQIVETSAAEELIAAELRGALHSLGQVVGEVYTDDILDRIFGQFCIGK